MVGRDIRLGASSTSAPLTTTSRQRTRRLLLWALALVVAPIVLLTFIWFVNPPTQEIETVQSADAVVLFAGNPERLHTAVELMEHGAAPNLVIPNGRTLGQAEHLCERASFEVYCPDTDPITTQGEAQAIGRLAKERGWSRLIAVTSVYHVHRATFLLGRCHDGAVEAVTPSRDLDWEDWMDKVGHEWAGFLAAIILQPAC